MFFKLGSIKTSSGAFLLCMSEDLTASIGQSDPIEVHIGVVRKKIMLNRAERVESVRV